MQFREDLECCKQRLTGDSGQRSDDQNSDRNADSKDQVQEALVVNKDFIGNSTRGYIYYALTKNLFSFCPSPETSKEARFKGYRQTNTVQQISRQPNIQAVTRVLLAVFSQIYCENLGQTAEQKKIEKLKF